MNKLIASVLALVMVMCCGTAFAEEYSATNNTVKLTVDGEESVMDFVLATYSTDLGRGVDMILFADDEAACQFMLPENLADIENDPSAYMYTMFSYMSLTDGSMYIAYCGEELTDAAGANYCELDMVSASDDGVYVLTMTGNMLDEDSGDVKEFQAELSYQDWRCGEYFIDNYAICILDDEPMLMEPVYYNYGDLIFSDGYTEFVLSIYIELDELGYKDLTKEDVYITMYNNYEGTNYDMDRFIIDVVEADSATGACRMKMEGTMIDLDGVEHDLVTLIDFQIDGFGN